MLKVELTFHGFSSSNVDFRSLRRLQATNADKSIANPLFHASIKPHVTSVMVKGSSEIPLIPRPITLKYEFMLFRLSFHLTHSLNY